MPQPSKTRIAEVLAMSMSYADPELKEEWHRVIRTQLRKVAKQLNGLYGQNDPVRSNKGGIAVSGEVTLHCDHLYIQVSQSIMGRGHDILYRSCTSRRDYSGGRNNFAHVNDLLHIDELVSKITTNVRNATPTLGA